MGCFSGLVCGTLKKVPSLPTRLSEWAHSDKHTNCSVIIPKSVKMEGTPRVRNSALNTCWCTFTSNVKQVMWTKKSLLFQDPWVSAVSFQLEFYPRKMGSMIFAYKVCQDQRLFYCR